MIFVNDSFAGLKNPKTYSLRFPGCTNMPNVRAGLRASQGTTGWRTDEGIYGIYGHLRSNLNGIYGYRRSNKYDSRERFLIDLRLIKT